MPIETAEEYEQIEQAQREAHAPLMERSEPPLYEAEPDAYELIDREH